MSKELFFLYQEWLLHKEYTALIKKCNELLILSGFTILNSIQHVFQPQGYTAIWLLAESHLAIHTFPEHNATFIELCSCSEEILITFQKHFLTFQNRDE